MEELSSNLSTFIANKETHRVDNILLKDYLHCKITHYGYNNKALTRCNICTRSSKSDSG